MSNTSSNIIRTTKKTRRTLPSGQVIETSVVTTNPPAQGSSGIPCPARQLRRPSNYNEPGPSGD